MSVDEVIKRKGRIPNANQCVENPLTDFNRRGGRDGVNTPQEVGLLEFLILDHDWDLVRVQQIGFSGEIERLVYSRRVYPALLGECV